jgi:hypothetical protein
LVALFVSLVACSSPQKGATRGNGDSGPADDGGRSDGGGSGGKDDAGGDGGGGAGGTGGSTGMAKCADIKCDANASCDDSDGTPKCACNSGYTGDGKKCSDVDECAKNNGGCDDHATCVNREGGFRCVCNETFTGDGKTCTGTNECDDVALNTCDPNAACKDTTTGFSCGACKAGYMSDSGACTDANECAGSNDCVSNSTCKNTFGGYDCACDPGFTGDGKDSCTGLCAAAIAAGTDCSPNAICHVDTTSASTPTSTITAAVCDACKPGYTGDGQTCTAANDCPTDCDGTGGDDKPNAQCTGTAGSRNCTCAPGFSGTPSSGCTDIDECNGGIGDCGGTGGDPAKDKCINLPGGHVCSCQPGYQMNEYYQCVDINECTSGEYPCHPNAKCTNTDGTFTCACKDGYEGDGKTCIDVDECKKGDDNCLTDGTARCVNTTGGFECRCLRGYTGDGVKSCKNIDECKDADLNDCADNATCTDASPKDNPLGYDCACGSGLGGDGTSCADVDECKNASLNDCAKNSTCVNKAGGYECQCKAPFAGDDPGACYCDLSGWWAMRQDVHTTWPEIKISSISFISSGEQDSTVWELHKYTYDGEKVVVEKKACGSDVDPDFISPLFSETYCSYIPKEVFYSLPLYKGRTIPEPGIVPGSMFTTPPEAAVAGIDLGPNPESATWPTDPSKIHDVGGAPPAWKDDDHDGEPGLTGWPHLPSEAPISSDKNDKYSYLPMDNAGPSGTANYRLGCSSSGSRVMGQLDVDVESCTKMTGTAVSLRSEGYVHSCIRVANADKNDDITCKATDWTNAGSDGRCNASQLDDLNSQANPDEAPVSKAKFELIKIGELSEKLDCKDVIKALPAIKR